MAKLESIQLGENWRDIITFTYQGETFKRDTKIRDYLNSLFSASLQAVYTQEDAGLETKHGLDWSGECIIIVNAKNEVGYMTNSEWASFDKL